MRKAHKAALTIGVVLMRGIAEVNWETGFSPLS